MCDSKNILFGFLEQIAQKKNLKKTFFFLKKKNSTKSVKKFTEEMNA